MSIGHPSLQPIETLLQPIDIGISDRETDFLQKMTPKTGKNATTSECFHGKMSASLRARVASTTRRLQQLAGVTVLFEARCFWRAQTKARRPLRQRGRMRRVCP